MIPWVNNLRWIWIILIVLWHSFFADSSLLVHFIFTFHVALFFFLSGFLFNDKKYLKLIPFVKIKFNRLIIPFVIFNLIMFLYLKLREIAFWEISFVNTINFIKWILYWSYLPWHDEIILTNVPTWFLISLFVVTIYYFFLNKIIINRFYRILALFILSILVFIESKYVIFRLPWSLEISIMAMLFYWIWHTFKNEIFNFVEKINYKYLLLVPFLVLFNLNMINWANFSTNEYWWNYILFLLNWFFWILLVLIFSKLFWKNKILDFLWRYSIVILGFEWIKFLVLQLIINSSFWYLSLEKSYLIWFIQLFSTLIVISFWILFYNYFQNKYFLYKKL